MRYALLAVVWLMPLFAQDVKPPEPMKGTFSNLDKEPPPYMPDAHLGYAASVRTAAPGPKRLTMGQQIDFAKANGLSYISNHAYEGLADTAAAMADAGVVPVFTPVYIPYFWYGGIPIQTFRAAFHHTAPSVPYTSTVIRRGRR